MISNKPFFALVESIMREEGSSLRMGWRANAVLQVAAEGFVGPRFADADLVSRAAKRRTVWSRDVRVAKRIRAIVTDKQVAR